MLDIGGGTSEVAIITMAGIANAQSVRVAGDAMNMAVQRYMRDVFRMEVGDNTAENVKKILGSAMPMPNAPVLEVSGKEATTARQYPRLPINEQTQRLNGSVLFSAPTITERAPWTSRVRR